MSGTTPTRSRAGGGPHPTPPKRSPAGGDAPRSLVEQLGDALRDERVACLQWKGNWKRNRWMSGEGDIDLLVDRPGEARFRSVLTTLGFRRADPPPQSAIAGIESYFGLDPVTGRLIHVHAHYRLVIGGIWRTVYRLPIETPLLASAVQGTVFRVPAGEFELITFAARMVQRYSAIDTLRRRQPAWLTGIQGELDALLAKTDRARLEQLLATHLPCLDVPFIDACIASLRPGYRRWARVALGRELHRRLRPHARRPPLTVTLTRVLRWFVTLGGRLDLWTEGRKHLAHGGTVVALVGGDGAGKSTCVRELRQWLSDEFAIMTAHLGRPPRSLLTLAIGAVFKAAGAMGVCAVTDAERLQARGYLAALRDVCTARDRYRLYVKARQFSLAGGLALCERYPIPQNRELSGPQLELFADRLEPTRLGRWLIAIEAAYYKQILLPDLLIVLLVDPEVAVRRKTDEPADYVRQRGELVWSVDWNAAGARVVDAGQPLADVVADLKAILWQEL